MSRKRPFDIVIVIVLLLAVAGLAALRETQNAGQTSEPSTYDDGPGGYAAAYELLQREGARTERFRLPIADLANSTASTLVLAGDGAWSEAVPSRSARDAVLQWVGAGGRLVVLDARIDPGSLRALGLSPPNRMDEQQRARVSCGFVPRLRGLVLAGTFTSGFRPRCSARAAALLIAGALAPGIVLRHRKGSIAILTSATPFDNRHLAREGNARIAYALFGSRAVAFDERIHGFPIGRSFWDVLPRPMRVAICIALAAGLLAIIGANLPFAPPYEVRAADERDSGAYIASVARMLQRGGATREAIERIAARCEHLLSLREAGDERARMLLRELRTLQASPRPGTNDLVQAGRIFARVRKDYGW